MRLFSVSGHISIEGCQIHLLLYRSNVCLHLCSFMLFDDSRSSLAAFGLLFRLYLPEFLLGTGDLRHFSLYRCRG